MNWINRLQQMLGLAQATTTASPPPVAPKVLVIVHNPTVAVENDRRLTAVLGWHEPDDLIGQFVYDIKAASHGYGRYDVVERIVVDDFPVKADGFQYDAENYLFRWRSRTGFHHPDGIDYHHLLAQFDVAARINSGDIDEVWLLGFPYAGYYESMMAGPGAFWCNAPPLTLAAAERPFVIMGFNYERGAGEMLESFGHRAESIMAHVFRQKEGASNLWQRFVRHEMSHPGQAECGNIHFAPNSEREYDWGNTRPIPSRADTWLDFPDLTGEPRLMSAQDWGKGDIRQHHLWWLGHLPHVDGRSAGISHNWWEYILDPSRVR